MRFGVEHRGCAAAQCGKALPFRQIHIKRSEATPRNMGGGASKVLLSVIGKPKAYRTVRRQSRILATLPIILALSLTAHAQQPFTTDDADVTERRKFQLQISHEFDILPRDAYPSLSQNTTVFALNYGLVEDVEIGIDGPLIVISNSHVATPRTITGVGDLNLHVKYNFLKEREGKARPALTVSFAVEAADGRRRQGARLWISRLHASGYLAEIAH